MPTARCVLKRRKITPTFHERMIWGQGDGSGLTVVDTAVGRVGALACWEHYNPLARYALMAQHEEIHVAQFPGSMVGPIFADQMEVTIRHHALESGCFVVNSTGWLADLRLATEIVVCPIVRDADGLALSSRNAYLTPSQRTQALILSRAVRHVESLVAQGERRASVLLASAHGVFAAEPEVRIDSIALVDWATLEPVETAVPGTLFAVAARVGSTRLIDNAILS